MSALADTIPTKLSVDDPDYDPDLGARLVVSVNGVAQSHVTAYDIGAGHIYRFKDDKDGQIVAGKDGWPGLEIIKGDVAVTLRGD